MSLVKKASFGLQRTKMTPTTRSGGYGTSTLSSWRLDHPPRRTTATTLANFLCHTQNLRQNYSVECHTVLMQMHHADVLRFSSRRPSIGILILNFDHVLYS